MSAKIRKLTLSYPFLVDNRQQRTVFSVDDASVKMGKQKIHTIQEQYDEYHRKMKYLICVCDGDRVVQWKEIIPSGCSIEIEYHIQ